MQKLPKTELYLSLDVETNGPVPGLNSMWSLGAALFNYEGELTYTFHCNLQEMEGTTSNPDTMEWWSEQPLEIFDAARINSLSPEIAMKEFDAWLPAPSKVYNLVPIGWPISYDHMWVNWYGWRWLNKYVIGYAGEDLRSYLHGVAGSVGYYDISEEATWRLCGQPDLSMYGELRDHIAVDDAIKQGALFFHLRKHRLHDKSV